MPEAVQSHVRLNADQQSSLRSTGAVCRGVFSPLHTDARRYSQPSLIACKQTISSSLIRILLRIERREDGHRRNQLETGWACFWVLIRIHLRFLAKEGQNSVRRCLNEFQRYALYARKAQSSGISAKLSRVLFRVADRVVRHAS